MTRMIERWFPCTEVSDASKVGWGSGASEKSLFTWFAARPSAQAKAAVLTSLLPWPADEAEQRRLQELVRLAMSGRDTADSEVRAELVKAHGDTAAVADIFSGRAMIPFEAARLGVQSYGFDYSPVATLAGQLLADYCVRDWSREPALSFVPQSVLTIQSRLADDAAAVLAEIGRRHDAKMTDFYPEVGGQRPWGYLWATTLPCQECGNRFPVTGSLTLRQPNPRKSDPGQSYDFVVDRQRGTFEVDVHDGVPSGQATLVAITKGGKATRGKSAICIFCDNVHAKAVHARLMSEQYGRDVLLAVAEIDRSGRRFRTPTTAEFAAATTSETALAAQPDFAPGLPAVPDEAIPPGNNDTVRPSAYGSRTYGDLCNARQTLSFVHFCRSINDLGRELIDVEGVSSEYAQALVACAGATLVRKLRYSTRGAWLRSTPGAGAIAGIYVNEASVAFSYDYVETGLGAEVGTWTMFSRGTISAVRKVSTAGRPAEIARTSATSLPLRTGILAAVITDPPYDNMIDYSDASDLFFVWLKRALISTSPWWLFRVNRATRVEGADVGRP